MAGKSSMSANSFNGSLEVGKRTWREGVKLWFKRFIKKKKKKKKKNEYKRDLLSQSKWIQLLSPNGPKVIEANLIDQTRWKC